MLAGCQSSLRIQRQTKCTNGPLHNRGFVPLQEATPPARYFLKVVKLCCDLAADKEEEDDEKEEKGALQGNIVSLEKP